MGFFTLNINERKFFIFVGDIIIVISSLKFLVSNVIRGDYDIKQNTYVFIFGISFFILISYVLDLYNPERLSKIKSIIPLSFVIGLLFSITLLLGVIFIINTTFSRYYLFLFLILTPIILSIWRFITAKIFINQQTLKSTIYIYDCDDRKEKNLNHIRQKKNEIGYKIKLTLLSKDDTNYFTKKRIKNALNKVDALILDVIDKKNITPELERFVNQAILKGLEFQTYSSFYEYTNEAVLVDIHSNGLIDLVQIKNKKIRYFSNMFSFFVNFFLVVFVGIVFVVFIPFVFLLNIFFNKGPLFYSQLRVGKKGKEFKIYKFRSMVIDAENKGAKMAVKNDSRVTRFGKILRKFRIDELPQIISIIKGDMAFIGPRPERKLFVDQLIEITPYYNIRHLVKPGITGWAQVKYKYGENLDDSIKKLEYDLYYIKNKSITLEIRILFKTITTVLFSRGI